MEEKEVERTDAWWSGKIKTFMPGLMSFIILGTGLCGENGLHIFNIFDLKDKIRQFNYGN